MRDDVGRTYSAIKETFPVDSRSAAGEFADDDKTQYKLVPKSTQGALHGDSIRLPLFSLALGGGHRMDAHLIPTATRFCSSSNRAFLPGQDDPHHRRLYCRRSLRPVRADSCASYAQVHSGKPEHHRAKYARRRLADRNQLCLRRR